MQRIQLGEFIYDVGYQNGFYFARSIIGESPVGRNLNELAQGLSNCTGFKALDILNDIF
ncbi:TPA: hypothetical protein ACGEB1_002479 [Yersinia enterocolitica]